MRQCLLAIVRLAGATRLPTTLGTLQRTRATTEKVRGTLGAASKFALPGCEAITVHSPTPVRCAVAPLTVQRPLPANETGKPEDAVAETRKSGAPNVLFESGPKLIDWLALVIANVCETSGAGL